VKYNLISDLCAFEILVRRFLKAYKGTHYNHHFEASKLSVLPVLDPEDEAEIIKKWTEEANKEKEDMMGRDMSIGRRPPHTGPPMAGGTPGPPSHQMSGTGYLPHPNQQQQVQQIQHQQQQTVARPSPMTTVPTGLASMDLNHFYNNLPYPKIVPHAEMEETRRRLLPIILEQRSVSPPVHVAFLYNCHLLAVITHGLLSYKKFHEEYRKTFNYSVPPNVTLRKLLSRYPTLFDEINMEDPNDKGIKNNRGEHATQEDIYRCAAIDDWNDSKCPYHLREFWLQPEWVHLLPDTGAPSASLTKAQWGNPRALNLPPLQMPPWASGIGGVSAGSSELAPPQLQLQSDLVQNNTNDYTNGGQLNYMNDHQPNVSTPPVITDAILDHPVAVALKFIYELVGKGNKDKPALSLRECALLLSEKLVPYGGGGILSMMSEWERKDDNGGSSGHISDILQKDSPYDDGGSLLTKKDEDIALFFRQLPELFKLIVLDGRENRVEIVPYPTNLDISYVLARSLRSHGFRDNVI